LGAPKPHPRTDYKAGTVCQWDALFCIDADRGGHIPFQARVLLVGLHGNAVDDVALTVLAESFDLCDRAGQLETGQRVEGDDDRIAWLHFDDVQLSQVVGLDLPACGVG
jgi:hypothetical protein